MRLHEIEIGGGVDSSFLDDLKGRADYTHPQRDLFPDIPTLDPSLPRPTVPDRTSSSMKMEIVGTIGSFRVVKSDLIVHPEQEKENRKNNPYQGNENDYVVFDRNQPIGWAGVLMPPKRGFDVDDISDGTAGQVGSIYIDQAYRGKNLALALYRWLLTNVCDYIVMDELQTMGGVKVWRRALNSKAFDVMVFDKRTGMSRRRWAGKRDFDRVYQTYDLIPWMTLAGKADQLLSG